MKELIEDWKGLNDDKKDGLVDIRRKIAIKVYNKQLKLKLEEDIEE